MWKIQNKINRICKRFDVSILYQTTVGIKCTNQLVSSDMFNYFASGETKYVPAENLWLTFDGLKDSYTLLYRSVADSPHFELMQLLQKGTDLNHSDYLRRVVDGTLDFRPAKKISPNHIRFLRNSYSAKINSIQAEVYQPIKVFKVGDKYYIADGKHTAAMCALVGINAKCIDVSLVVYDSFFWWVYRKMLKNKKDYSKHIKYFGSLLKTSIPDY